MRLTIRTKPTEYLGNRGNLGGDIYIHGACVSIGCIPVTDEKIKELYIYAVEAANNGQEKIPVYIYPARFTDTNCQRLFEEFGERKDLIEFWKNLKEGYDRFQAATRELNVSVGEGGYYRYN